MQLNNEVIKAEISEAAERMGLDYEDLAPMIPEVVEDCLVKATNLIQIIEAGDVEQIHAIAHDVKGVCANYGLNKPSEIAKIIETNRESLPMEEAKSLLEHFTALSGFAFEE